MSDYIDSPSVSETKDNEDEVLYNADPTCEHDIRSSRRGGIKCVKCSGWFCF